MTGTDVPSAVTSPRGKLTRAPTKLRWIAVGLGILYGFAKLNGAQFTILDSELAKPLGQVSGFWLTWYYFGYSPVYGSLIAVVQIGGALLLAWPRTALLGALLLLPVFGNIVLINLDLRHEGASVVLGRTDTYRVPGTDNTTSPPGLPGQINALRPPRALR